MLALYFGTVTILCSYFNGPGFCTWLLTLFSYRIGIVLVSVSHSYFIDIAFVVGRPCRLRVVFVSYSCCIQIVLKIDLCCLRLVALTSCCLHRRFALFYNRIRIASVLRSYGLLLVFVLHVYCHTMVLALHP